MITSALNKREHGAIGAVLFFIVIVRLFLLAPSLAIVLRSALLYLLGSHNYSGGCMATTSERGTVTVRSMLPILGASTIGTSIEWYDFFLYGFLAATVFPKLFFPELSPVVGTIASFTTYFVGFAARPIGGAFFGWFGDRVGRKSTLIATLLLMGIATALMGLVPGYTSIGL